MKKERESLDFSGSNITDNRQKFIPNILHDKKSK